MQSNKKSKIKGQAPATQTAPKVPAPIFARSMWCAIIAAAVGLLLYANSIANLYVLDDAAVITDHPYVQQGLSGIGKIFTTDASHFSTIQLGYYRPLSFATFAIEQQLFHGNPHISHLVNVLLFALTGFFLCLLLMRIFDRYHPVFAFAMTLLFMVHPVHTEVVANIKGRDEILSFLNMIIALYLLLRAVPRAIEKEGALNYPLLVLSGFFFYLGLISKETAMVGVVLFPAALYFAADIPIKKLVAVSLPFVVLVVLFQVQKYAIIGGASADSGKDITIYPYTDPAVKIPSMLMLLAWCVKLVLLPYPLLYSYAYNHIPAADWSTPATLIGILLTVALAYFSIRGIRQKRPLNFGVICFAVTLAPSMAFVLLKGGTLAERMLYAPVMGFSIVLVYLVARFTAVPLQSAAFTFTQLSKKLSFTAPLLIIMLLCSAETVLRNADWHDNLTLYTHDIKDAGDNSQAHYHYALSVLRVAADEKDAQKQGTMVADAMSHLRQATAINTLFPDAYNQIGWVYQKFGQQYDSAIFYYNLSMMQGPKIVSNYYSLGTVYASTGKAELASYYFNKAVEINPRNAEAVSFRDNYKAKTGLDVKEFPASQNLDPLETTTPDDKKDQAFYTKIGVAYGKRGDLQNALRCLLKSQQLAPNNKETLVNLGICYGMINNYGQAVEILDKALNLYPNDIWAMQTLKATYIRMGKADKATELDGKINALGGK